ncbi:MAG: hydrogenase small subunit [Firmicutes bacterium]|nr:hydrogenase small subunit [Bacillota bacterium]
MLSRREFVKLCMSSTLSVPLTNILFEELVKAQVVHPEKPRALWLQAATCSGNTLSFANTVNPYLSDVVLNVIDLKYHLELINAFGEQSTKVIEDTVEKGDYILIVEGAIPTKDGGIYATSGERNGQPWKAIDLVRYAASRATYVIAIGVCAVSGGPFAGHPNPTGCVGVHEVIDKPVINCPGCPCHPDWFVGTLAHLLLYKENPKLDDFNRPVMFYGRPIHDLCDRRSYFENGIFAEYPGDFGCMYKIGCKGPITYADCPVRKWNEYVNWPVEDNAPCIGCANPGFPDASSPFFEHLPSIRVPNITVTANTVGVATAAVTVGAIGAHLVGNIIKGRPLGGTPHTPDKDDTGEREGKLENEERDK